VRLGRDSSLVYASNNDFLSPVPVSCCTFHLNLPKWYNKQLSQMINS
jgi:hypothetical protein